MVAVSSNLNGLPLLLEIFDTDLWCLFDMFKVIQDQDRKQRGIFIMKKSETNDSVHSESKKTVLLYIRS